HTVGPGGETGQLHLAGDLDAELFEIALQDPLGLALWDHEREGIGALDVVQGDVGDQLLARRHARAMADDAGRAEAIDDPGPLEELEGAAPQHQRLGFVGAGGGFVDDTDRHAIARQLAGHGEPDGSRAGDEHRNLFRHWKSPPGIAAARYAFPGDDFQLLYFQ